MADPGGKMEAGGPHRTPFPGPVRQVAGFSPHREATRVRRPFLLAAGADTMHASPRLPAPTMNAHLFLAHFPVALVLVGAAADLGGVLAGRERVRAFAGVLLMVGGGFALLAFFTGGGALADAMTRVPPGDPRLDAHPQWGAVGTWALVGGAVLRAAWRRSLHGWRGWVLLTAALASAAVVTGIAATGHAIAHG
jgi:uncharacterized membrane protein